MRQAAALTPEAQAERDARLRKRVFAAHFGGKCYQCRRREPRAGGKNCAPCHSRAVSEQVSRKRAAMAKIRKAEAKVARAAKRARARAQAAERRQAIRTGANRAYLDAML